VPLASQLNGVPFTHFLSVLGWHSVTTQLPWAHTNSQGVPSIQTPPVQVCGVRLPAPEHCVSVSWHVPVHVPALQLVAQVSPRTKCPVGSQW
jgi:hypothetical protein